MRSLGEALFLGQSPRCPPFERPQAAGKMADHATVAKDEQLSRDSHSITHPGPHEGRREPCVVSP